MGRAHRQGQNIESFIPTLGRGTPKFPVCSRDTPPPLHLHGKKDKRLLSAPSAYSLSAYSLHRSHRFNNVWAGGGVDGFQVHALLEELQAEPDTAISLPELTEIVALLLA